MSKAISGDSNGVRSWSKLSVPDNYAPVQDLCLITSYFNWNKYKTKRKNFDLFLNTLKRSGLQFLIVECALAGSQYELRPAGNVIQVMSNSVLWQKERLLNIALRHVPEQITKVAWIDGDVIFTNPTWAVETSSQLERYSVVQLFDSAVRLPPGSFSYKGIGDWYRSFGYAYSSSPDVLLKGASAEHGHSGFAWAARRECLDALGFYDGCIAGNGDHAMAHAFCGDWESPCVYSIFGASGPMHEHFREWCEVIYREVRGDMGYVPGCLLHLWHGNVANRRYQDRCSQLLDVGFNPYTDLFRNRMGCWEIAAHRESLRMWEENYFASRIEDVSEGTAEVGNAIAGF
jgi:hypothetical protein